MDIGKVRHKNILFQNTLDLIKEVDPIDIENIVYKL